MRSGRKHLHTERYLMGASIPVRINLPPHVYEWLDQRVKDGSFTDPASVARSILASVVDDDLHAHGEEFCNIIQFPRS